MGIRGLFPYLKEKISRFSALSMMLAMGFVIYDLDFVKIYFLYLQIIEHFHYKWMLNFVKTFSAYIEIIMCFAYFIFVDVVYHIECEYWIILHLWNKSRLIMEYDLFNVLAKLFFTNVLWSILHLVHQGYWPVIFLSFFILPLSAFGIRVMLALQRGFGSIPFSSIFWNTSENFENTNFC